MSHRTYRLWLWITAVLGVLVFIFANSLQSGEASGKESGALLAWLSRFFPFLTHHLLRKLAHFCEYALLGGILAFAPVLLPVSARRAYLLAFFFGIAVSLLDEGIQIFVPGRGASFTDVLIDSTGYLSALLLVLLVCYMMAKKGEKT